MKTIGYKRWKYRNAEEKMNFLFFLFKWFMIISIIQAGLTAIRMGLYSMLSL